MEKDYLTSNFQIELLAAFMVIWSPFEMNLSPLLEHHARTLFLLPFLARFQMQITRSHMSCRLGLFRINCELKIQTVASADPGEVKRVNFYPPFSEPLFFLFFFFLSLKDWNNIWFLWFVWLSWRMCISDDWFYQSIYSFWAHKHTVQQVIQKRVVSML